MTANHDAGTSDRGKGSTGAQRASALSSSPRAPRRVVLLVEGDESPVVEVLAEFRGPGATSVNLDEQLQSLAKAHPGRSLAAEWEGPRGWIRFLWCRR